MVGMDRLVSGITLYRRKNAGANDTADIGPPQTTGRHLCDLKSLMLQYWHPTPLFSRRDLLVVSHSKDFLLSDYFQGRAQEVGTVQKLTGGKTRKKGCHLPITVYSKALAR